MRALSKILLFAALLLQTEAVLSAPVETTLDFRAFGLSRPWHSLAYAKTRYGEQWRGLKPPSMTWWERIRFNKLKKARPDLAHDYLKRVSQRRVSQLTDAAYKKWLRLQSPRLSADERQAHLQSYSELEEKRMNHEGFRDAIFKAPRPAAPVRG